MKEKSKEIFELAKKLIHSNNLWQRRLAIVLLIELKKSGFNLEKIKKTLKNAENDKEYYVKKAIAWAKNELNKF
ncbi:MAG TPA: hypothetical protein ENL06_01195 [Candidatus Portnoybacteria bacterium]|nr:hypothetical protein [Candidatus Portnoybacteria bacterium]